MSAETLYFEALNDFKENRQDDALSKLKQVIDKDSRYEDAYEAIVVILYNQKKYDEAITLIKKWVTLFPKSHMAQTNLSRCYVAKDMILEAEQAQAEARKLSWAAELKGKKLPAAKVDYKEKISRYKQVIELDPEDVLGYFSLGQTYLDAGMKREAVDTFEKAVEVNPMHSSSYFGYGQALEGLGDIKKALTVYAKGIEVANTTGDMLTRKRMESRLRSLEESA